MPADQIIKINIDGIDHALAHKDGRGFYPARDWSDENTLYWSSPEKAQQTLDSLLSMISLLLDNECEVVPLSLIHI